MADGGIIALVLLGLALGLRHGIDWDHIAAITDITGSQVGTGDAAVAVAGAGGPPMAGQTTEAWGRAARAGFFLATMYALGHAVLVVALGLLAIWTSTILPDWIDPIMERLVGVTLIVLGAWIFFSLWRNGRSFRLQSRWMLIFALVGRAWNRAKGALTGEKLEHHQALARYGPWTAFGVGLLHGVGAETGSQALLLAGAAGATTAASGSVLLMAFVVGLLISNSLVAAFSAFGFVSSSTKQNVYLALGVIAGAASLVIGVFFVMGQGADLPDLQEAVRFVFGAAPVEVE